MMAGPINLNKVRKTRAKAEAEAAAAANRAKFGRTKAQKAQTAADKDKFARALDQARRED
jgi:Domain of unknown function (DUF4169)